jgi:hypothetical protein
MLIIGGICPQAKWRNFSNLLNEFLEEKVLSKNKNTKVYVNPKRTVQVLS